MTATTLNRPTMLKAFAAHDPAYDGVFFVAVKTTGIFCRPVCRARPPRPENVEFFPTAKDATRNGYRPCKLCKPLAPAKAPAVVTRLMNLIDAEPHGRVTQHSLRELKIDPSTARRQFRAYCGMTFAQYQRSRRVASAARRLRAGRSVTAAQVESGFESPSGFRQAMTRLLGAAPTALDAARILTAGMINTPLGHMLAVCDDTALLLLDFADGKHVPADLEKLRRRQGDRPAAAIVPGEHALLASLQQQLDEYFAGKRRTFTIRMRPPGTDFERAAWRALEKIPFGQTRSYAQQAAAIGAPRSVRAVGRANGRNLISILIPCHRVIGANGHLTGYGGGVARKAWLLEHERKVSA